MLNPIIVDWTESVYSDSGEFLEQISCSELFTTSADAAEFISSLDKSVCENITQT